MNGKDEDPSFVVNNKAYICFGSDLVPNAEVWEYIPDSVSATASFISSAKSVCSGGCITFTNTSTGSADSIRWQIQGIIIPKSDSNILTVCFPTAGSDTVTLFIFDSGIVDTVARIVMINPNPSPITGRDFICNNLPPYCTYLHDSTIGGIWSSSDTLVERVDSTGRDTLGISFTYYDSVIIRYTLPSGCFATVKVFEFECEAVPTVTNSNNIISIYPNPTTSTVTLISTNPITSLEITNLPGQTIFSHNYNSPKAEVDVSTLPTGVYFMRINGVEVRKFVKE